MSLQKSSKKQFHRPLIFNKRLDSLIFTNKRLLESFSQNSRISIRWKFDQIDTIETRNAIHDSFAWRHTCGFFRKIFNKQFRKFDRIHRMTIRVTFVYFCNPIPILAKNGRRLTRQLFYFLLNQFMVWSRNSLMTRITHSFLGLPHEFICT